MEKKTTMTRIELYDKLQPFFEDFYDKCRKDGEYALTNADEAAFLKEVEWRLTDTMPDDKDDDEPVYDKLAQDPEWVFGKFFKTPFDDERWAEIFLAYSDIAYEYFQGLLRTLDMEYDATHEEKAK